MHHQHPGSQDTYNQPTDQEMAEVLSQHTSRLKMSSESFQQKYGTKLQEVTEKAESGESIKKSRRS